MGDWLSIVFLILIGLILIYLELLFIPGTTILGLVGLGLCVIGIYLAFENFGGSVGTWVMIGTAVFSVGGFVYSMRSKTWKRFELQDVNRSKFNEGYSSDLKVGMEGVATSDLKPVGNGEFNSKVYEVKSRGEHVSSGSAIRVAKIDKNSITVELTIIN